MNHPSRTIAAGRSVRTSLAVEASITLLVALFTLLALDDITTDNSTTGFVPEYSLLALAGAWLLFFECQLWRKGRRILAGVSLLLLVSAAWVVRDGIGHKNAGGWSLFWPEYSVITVAWIWFAGVAVWLLAQGLGGGGSVRPRGGSISAG